MLSTFSVSASYRCSESVKWRCTPASNPSAFATYFCMQLNTNTLYGTPKNKSFDLFKTVMSSLLFLIFRYIVVLHGISKEFFRFKSSGEYSVSTALRLEGVAFR
ncbi:hypothetical protein D3C75_1125280 [compost metagenome]